MEPKKRTLDNAQTCASFVPCFLFLLLLIIVTFIKVIRQEQFRIEPKQIRKVRMTLNVNKINTSLPNATTQQMTMLK